MASHVKVVVPASTANLGPGFDCLGLALGLFNTVEMWASDLTPPVPLPWKGRGEQAPPAPPQWEGAGGWGDKGGLQIEIVGEGAGQLPEDDSNLIYRAALRVFEKAGRVAPPLKIRATNEIPLGSGLGSSAAAVVGGLVAANALLNAPFSRRDLLRLAFEIEGHPDNAAPAIFGGLVIVSASALTPRPPRPSGTTPTGEGGGELIFRSVDVPPLRVAIALPNVRLSTAEARAALPQFVPLPDAVFNIGRAALVVRALEQGDFDLLKWAMADRLHQPFRKRLIPGCDEATVAARKAGAAGVALSGAGPSLVAFAPDEHELVAQAMQTAFEKVGVSARTFILPVDRQGVRVSAAE